MRDFSLEVLLGLSMSMVPESSSEMSTSNSEECSLSDTKAIVMKIKPPADETNHSWFGLLKKNFRQDSYNFLETEQYIKRTFCCVISAFI